MDAYDRKLRSVYDAIDSRNYKGAVKQCTALLSKYKNDQVLRALKAVALTRMNSNAEANQICDLLVGEVMGSEVAVSLTSMALQALDRMPEVTRLHQDAVNSNPNNVDLVRALFGAYIREGHLIEQQKIAMKLQRLDPENEGLYAWWTVVVLYLQSSTEDTGQRKLTPQQTLQLAQAIAEKRLRKGGAEEGYEAFMTYLQVLEDQHKHKEALESLTTEWGHAIQLQGERLLLQAELLKRLGRYEEASAIAIQQWSKIPQDWAAFLLMLQTLIPSTFPSQTQVSEDVGKSDKFEEAEKIIESVTKNASEQNNQAGIRGTALAAVELEYRRQMRSSAGGSVSTSGREGAAPERTAPEGDRMPLAIYNCFQKLCSRLSCFADIRPYLIDLNERQRSWLADRILQHTRLDPTEPSIGFEELRIYISALQVQRALGYPKFDDSASAYQHAQDLMTVYSKSSSLCQNLDEKERGPADELPEIAVSSLVTAWLLDTSKSPTYLLHALVILDGVQQIRTVSAGLRLAAAALFGVLGAPLRAHAELQALNIKHIQHDTISGHMDLPALLSASCQDEAKVLLGTMIKFYKKHLATFGESIMTAFAAGNYTKVPEFDRFKERLARSAGRICTELEICTRELQAALMDSSAQLPSIASGIAKVTEHWSTWLASHGHQLRCNEDLGVRPVWFPPTSGLPELALADWWQDISQHNPLDRWSVKRLVTEGVKAPDAEKYTRERCLCLALQALSLEFQALSMSPSTQSTYSRQKVILERIVALQREVAFLGSGNKSSTSALQGEQKLQLSALPNEVNLAAFKSVLSSQEGVEGAGKDWLAFAALYEKVCSQVVAAIEQERSQSQLPICGPAWLVTSTLLGNTLWIVKSLALQPIHSSASGTLHADLKAASEKILSAVAQLKELTTRRQKKAVVLSSIWQASDVGRITGVESPMDKKLKTPSILVKLVEDQFKTLDRIDKIAAAILSLH